MQTGHRNTQPNVYPESKCNTMVASGLAAQNCQFDSPSHNLAWCSFPDEPNSEQVHLFSAPQQEFTRQQPKIFDRPRSQDNTPGRQFGLKLTTTTITITVCYFALICDAFRKISELSLDWAIWDAFLMQFRLFRKKWGSSLVENHQNMPGNGFLL